MVILDLVVLHTLAMEAEVVEVVILVEVVVEVEEVEVAVAGQIQLLHQIQFNPLDITQVMGKLSFPGILQAAQVQEPEEQQFR